MDKKIYDIIIIGGGPAGLTAGLYGGRSKLKTLIIEKGSGGGQVATTHDVANYPGSIHDNDKMNSIGPKLARRMKEQALHFGAEILNQEVINIDFSQKIKKIETRNGEFFYGKGVIIATGAVPKKLGCKGEGKLTGKGVSYCGTCDAFFFMNQEVFCIGGGDTAVEEAIYISKFARKVNIIVRKDHVRCATSILKEANENPKISFVYNTELLEIKGENFITSAIFLNNKTGVTYEHFPESPDTTFGIFMFIGYNPHTDIFKEHIKLDKWGYIPTSENMETNIPGIYAAGDLRPKLLRQVVTATADGAIAVTAAEKYIKETFKEDN